MIKKFRKKPVEIEAIQLTKDSLWEVYNWIDGDVSSWCWDEDYVDFSERYIEIKTLEGKYKAQEGDYVIKGVKGEFYPCKPEIFNLTYEEMF